MDDGLLIEVVSFAKSLQMRCSLFMTGERLNKLSTGKILRRKLSEEMRLS